MQVLLCCNVQFVVRYFGFVPRNSILNRSLGDLGLLYYVAHCLYPMLLRLPVVGGFVFLFPQGLSLSRAVMKHCRGSCTQCVPNIRLADDAFLLRLRSSGRRVLIVDSMAAHHVRRLLHHLLYNVKTFWKPVLFVWPLRTLILLVLFLLL